MSPWTRATAFIVLAGLAGCAYDRGRLDREELRRRDAKTLLLYLEPNEQFVAHQSSALASMIAPVATAVGTLAEGHRFARDGMLHGQDLPCPWLQGDVLASRKKAERVTVQISDRELAAPRSIGGFGRDLYTSGPELLAQFVHPFANMQVQRARGCGVDGRRAFLEANPRCTGMIAISGRHASVCWWIAVLEVDVEPQDIAIPGERLTDVSNHQHSLCSVYAVLVCQFLRIHGDRFVCPTYRRSAANARGSPKGDRQVRLLQRHVGQLKGHVEASA